MKHIQKKAENEPPLIKALKSSTEGASFKSIYPQAKRELKRALLREQGHICAYCMRKIEFINTSIEHYLPQSDYPEV